MDHNCAEKRQQRTHLIKDPAGQILTGRILQTGDLIEVMVIQPLISRLEQTLDLGKVHDPSGVRIDIAAQMQLDAERMPVQSRALVALGHVGQPMRRFERKNLKNVHAVLSHGQASGDSLALRTMCPMRLHSRLLPPLLIATALCGVGYGSAFAQANEPQQRTVYRCVKDNTVSLATFREKGAKCEPKTITDTAGKPTNIFGNLGVINGNLYEGTVDGKPALTTRKTKGFTLLTRFTVETPKDSTAHVGMGQVGKARTDAFNSQFKAAAKKHKVDEALLRAVAHAESGFVAGIVSPKGALGVMQLMPATARELGVTNALDPTQSIDGGARYLSQLSKRYRGDMTRIIAAYNAGPGAVAKFNGVPPYRETLAYLDKVNALLLNYKAALGLLPKPKPPLKAAQ